MATYTITVGAGSGDLDGFYGYYPDLGPPFPTGFGSISPAGSEVSFFVWTSDGATVAIGSNTLSVGTEVIWQGETYVLDDGAGGASYSGPGLGGTYPTSGTTDFDVGGGPPPSVTGTLDAFIDGVSGNFSGFVGSISGALNASLPLISNFTGTVADPTITGSLDAAVPVNAAFTNIPDPTGSITANVAVNGNFKGVVLPNEPGKVALISGTSWTVPVGWNSSNNSVTCIGAGGSASSGVILTGGAGGGGGAGAQSSNLSYLPGDVVTIRVGANIDTVFGGTTLGACTVGAQKGSAASGSTGGAGGLASASVGAVKYNGGTGGNGGTSGFTPLFGSGGGAGGPNGAGGNGSTQVNIITIADGGDGDGGLGGAGGDTFNVDGQNGTELGAIVGSGGGGAAPGGEPGYYGAGGGSGPTPRSGSPGIIYIEWVPLRGFTYGFIIG